MRQRNLLCLMGCQVTYTAAGAIALVVTGVAGFQLAEVKILATLPFALIHVTTALVTFPFSLLMHRFGRRACFVFGAAAGLTAATIGLAAIVNQSFLMLCVGSAFFGLFQASAEYYRFAAAEFVPEDQIRKTVSWTIFLSLVGVLVGPLLGASLDMVFSPLIFIGNYLVIGLFSAITIALAMSIDDSRAQPFVSHIGRHLGAALQRPQIAVAMVTSAISFAVMVTAMTALPLASITCGLSVGATGGIIQLHLLGMYIPSLLASHIAGRISVGQLLAAGGVIMLIGLWFLYGAASFIPFGFGLFMIGVGWNLIYVSTTEILAGLSDSQERATAQGFHELLEFAVISGCALGAGAFYVLMGWDTLIMTLSVLALGVLGALLMRAKGAMARR